MAGTWDSGDARWQGARWQGRVMAGTRDGRDAMAGCSVAGTQDSRGHRTVGTHDSRDTGWWGHGTVGTQNCGDTMAGCSVLGTRDGGDTGQWGTRDGGDTRWRGRDGGVLGGRDA